MPHVEKRLLRGNLGGRFLGKMAETMGITRMAYVNSNSQKRGYNEE